MKRVTLGKRIVSFLLGLTLLGGDILPALAAVPEEKAVNETESISGDDVADEEADSYGSSADGAFPYSYNRENDIREYFSTNYPMVRNSNPYGTSWAFSTVSLAEFYLIRHGFVRDPLAIDLSELHLAHFTYSQGTVGAAPYTGDKIETSFADIREEMDYGGSYEWAAQTLMRQRGFAVEKTAPYSPNGTLVAPDASTERDDRFYLYNAYKISLAKTAHVKEAIINNGSVGVRCYLKDDYYNPDTNAYYCNDKHVGNYDKYVGNYTVTIVGWDDAYPASNFNNVPSGNGAWLVRNCCNDGSSDLLSFGCYFWMSYYDRVLSSSGYAYVFEVEPIYYDNHYYYDSQIHETAVFYGSYGSAAYYSANVYTANGNEKLSAVTLDVKEVDPEGTEYEIQIYKDVEAGGNPSTGVLVSSATTGGVFYYDGYYTIDLPQQVGLKSGESFAIVVKRSDGVSVSAEAKIVYPELVCSVSCDSGQSFVSSTGETWSDIEFLKDHGQGNLLISALTYNSATIMADKPLADLPSGSTIHPGQKIELTSATDGASIYYSIDGSIPTVNSMIYDPAKGIVLSRNYAEDTFTIKAIAVADGYDTSEVAEFIYIVEKLQEPDDDTLSVIQKDGVYGESLPKPVYVRPVETGTEFVTYSGTITKDGTAYGPTSEAPSLPGRYLVVVIYQAGDKNYSGSAEFEIKKAEWKKKQAMVPGEAGKEGRYDLKKYIADGGVLNADEISVVSGENQLKDKPRLDNTTLLCPIKDNIKNINIILDIPVTGMDNYNDYSITVNIIGQTSEVIDGKITLNNEEVGSLTEAFGKMKDPYKDYVIDIGMDITGEKNLTIPKSAKSVIIYGNGHTVEIIGTKLTANVPLSIDGLKIKALTKSRLAAKFTLMAKKDLNLGRDMVFETAATTVKCNGRLVLTGRLDAKTVTVKDMTLESRGILEADAGSNITVKGALKGLGGKIELGTGFNKPLKISGTVDGNIKMTGKKQADGTQLLKCSAKKIPAETLRKTFDLSEITNNATDTYLYYFGAGKATVFGESISYNGSKYGVWKDAVAAMNADLKTAKKNQTSISFVIELNGNVNMKGYFKLPSKGYESLTINGNGNGAAFTGDITLTGNTVINDLTLYKVDKKGNKVSGKVKKGKYTYEGPETF